MSTKPSVFISHIADEAPIADLLKTYLKRCFGESLAVFVSSDYDSIPTGNPWFRTITDAIMSADAVIVLLSPDSVDRRWINFEAGLAFGAQKRSLPLTIRGCNPVDVPAPLSQLHLRPLLEELSLEGILGAIAEATGLGIIRIDRPADFLKELTMIETGLPIRDVRLEPVLDRNSRPPLLRFRLSNTGNRDIELIEVEVCVPVVAILKDWNFQPIPNVTSFEHRKIATAEYICLWEKPFEGPIDRIQYGVRRTLPRILSPHWTPRFSDLVQVPIRPDLTGLEHVVVQYKVVARGVYTEGTKSLSELLF